MKDPISGINSFLNKQFGVPLPKNNRYSSSTMLGPYKYPNMSVAPTTNMSVAPNMSMVPNSTSATSPKAPVITTPQKTNSTLPPAGQTFIQNQTQDIYDKATGARTAYGASIGAKDMLGGKEVSPINKNSTTSPVAPPKAPESPYLAYLKSMFDPEKLTMARNNMESLNKRTSAELLRTREREEELRKNEIGQLERGQSYQLGEEERLSNKSLADLAIAKGANIDTINTIMGAGKEAYELSQPIEVGGVLYQRGDDGNFTPLTGAGTDGFTLGKDQTRFEYDKNTGQYVQVAAGSGSGAGGNGLGGDPISLAYADAVLSGKTKLENIPEEYRGAVAMAIAGQEVTQETSPYLAQIAVQGRQAVKGLLSIAESNPGIFGRSAAAPIPGMLRSDAFRNYEAQLDYLRGNLIPASLTAMREASKTGGALGQVSDREGAWLASALGALSMTQEASEVQKQLKLIDESLSRWEKAVNTYGKSSGGSTGDSSLYDW